MERLPFHLEKLLHGSRLGSSILRSTWETTCPFFGLVLYRLVSGLEYHQGTNLDPGHSVSGNISFLLFKALVQGVAHTVFLFW